jgi:hypothetical protein
MNLSEVGHYHTFGVWKTGSHHSVYIRSILAAVPATRLYSTPDQNKLNKPPWWIFSCALTTLEEVSVVLPPALEVRRGEKVGTVVARMDHRAARRCIVQDDYGEGWGDILVVGVVV